MKRTNTSSRCCVSLLGAVLLGACAGEAPVLEPSGTIIDARPPMVIDGVGVSWLELRQVLAEGAGRGVLEEIVLDRRLGFELERRGLEVTESNLTEERRLLESTLSGAVGDEDLGVLAEREVLARRGLGPVRLERLLWRNAALRLLSAGAAEVEASDARREFEALHGEKFIARMIFVPTLREAGEALGVIREDAARRGMLGAVIGAAARFSTDATARTGGLAPTISGADPGYPAALMNALRSLDEGEISAPIALERDFALVYLERRLPADDVRFDEVADEMYALAADRKRRAAMSELAGELLRSARVSTFDASVRSAWERGGRR